MERVTRDTGEGGSTPIRGSSLRSGCIGGGRSVVGRDGERDGDRDAAGVLEYVLRVNVPYAGAEAKAGSLDSVAFAMDSKERVEAADDGGGLSFRRGGSAGMSAGRDWRSSDEDIEPVLLCLLLPFRAGLRLRECPALLLLSTCRIRVDSRSASAFLAVCAALLACKDVFMSAVVRCGTFGTNGGGGGGFDCAANAVEEDALGTKIEAVLGGMTGGLRGGRGGSLRSADCLESSCAAATTGLVVDCVVFARFTNGLKV